MSDHSTLMAKTAVSPVFDDLKGPEQAKWTLEVAASGAHNVLMVGLL